MLPKLQLACDHNTIEAAVRDAKAVGASIDILEAGTRLLLCEGASSITALKAARPELPLAADPKCVDAGEALAKICAEAGCNYMTVTSAASRETIKAAAAVVDEVQIELFGSWTYEDAQMWLDAGATQAIYHQGRDGGFKAWSAADFERITHLAQMGFKMSLAGGISKDSLASFADLPVYAFIVGSSIYTAPEPAVAAQEIKDEIVRIWG